MWHITTLSCYYLHVKLIQYRFWCTRCVFRLLLFKSLQWYFSWKSWKSEEKKNKMCYETQIPPNEANSRGGHHPQNPRSRFQNLQLQYKGLVTSNMPMKYKSPITYHSKDMGKVNFFKSGSKYKIKVTRSKAWYH
jgi:hypothetical protein